MTSVTRSRRGWTLVELGVVLVIMGVVAGAAAGSYAYFSAQGATSEAQERLGRVAVAEQIAATSAGGYSPFARDLQVPGSDIVLLEDGQVSDAPTEVSFTVSVDGYLGLAVADTEACQAMVLSPPGSDTESRRFALDGVPCSGTYALTHEDADADAVDTGTDGSVYDQW